MFARKLLLSVALASLLTFAACAPTPETVTISSDGQPAPETGNAAPPVGSGPGSSEPGAGAETGQAPPSGAQNGSPGTWVSYVNSDYKFSLNYPSDYKFSSQSADKLAGLKPTPVAAWIFLSPEKASSDVSDLEPADLEIRVFDARGATSLDGWLKSVGLQNAGVTSKSFKTDNASGVQLCATTMIFPGCSYFILGKDRVYQLVAASQVGEDMVKTFAVIP